MSFLLGILAHIGASAAVLKILDQYLLGADFEIGGGVTGYLLVAVVFGILNSFVKPILNLVTIPIKVLTLGASSLVLNGILLWAGEFIVNFLQFSGTTINVGGVMAYLLAGFGISATHTLIHKIV